MWDAQRELTRQFYEWEHRGRGHQQWPEPVCLEPPFRPFFGHFIKDAGEIHDDGRRPTPGSRVADWLFRRASPSPTAGPQDAVEPKPNYAASDEDVVELALAMPDGTRVEREACEALLLSLASCRASAAFEIIATSERISAFIAAKRSDSAHVGEEVRSFFPSAAVAEGEGFLAETWSAAPGFLSIAECALTREFVLPLRTFLRPDPDPLVGVVGSLCQLGEGETAVFQVLFELARNPWAESVRAAVTDGEGGAFFLDAPELTHLALEKVSHPLFAVVLRLAASSNRKGRASEIVRKMAGPLALFGRPDGNEFSFAQNDLGVDLEQDLLFRTSHRSGMLLSVGELAAIVHPPSASVVAPKLVRRLKRTKAAPPSTADQSIILGWNEHTGRTVAVGISPELRMRHLHVVGASGTGKSTFLLDLIVQTMEAGDGIAVLDPHGDLVDEVLSRVPQGREENVVYLDASDAQHPIGLNLLAAHSELERTVLSSDLVAVFRRLSTTWGDQMQTVLANAIQAFLASREGGSLADLRRFLVEPEFRREYLKSVEDDEIIYYWTREFPLLVGKPAGPILTRLDGFLRPKPLRAMLGQRENRLDFREIIDKQRIFLAKLAQGAIGEENAALLGSVLVAKFHQAALSRQNLPRESRRHFHLVIDELQEVVTPSLAAILSGARKYGLGLTAAHQNLRQLYEADPSVAAALLANAATRVVFRVGEDDAKKLADGFASFDAQALTTLGVGEAICRIDRSDQDFNLSLRRTSLVDPSIAESRRHALRELSQRKYGSCPDKSEARELTQIGTVRETRSAAPPQRKQHHPSSVNEPDPADKLRTLIRKVSGPSEKA